MSRWIDCTHWLCRETQIVLRFGVTGVLATLTHLGVVFLWIECGLPVLIGNVCAFCLAFCISFFGNYYWTFHKPDNPWKVMFRFFIVSGSGFVVNMSLLILLRSLGLKSIHATMFAGLAVPLYSFIANRLWAFRQKI